MSEYDPLVPGPAPRSRGFGRAMKFVLAALLLVLLIAGGYRGWKIWQRHADSDAVVAAQETLLRRLSRQVAEQGADLDTLRQRAAELAESQRQSTEELATVRDRSNEFDHALAQLSASIQGGRTRAQLAAVEQLLLIANDRAQLAHDTPGAAAALQAAQDHLATLSEPRLLEVRKAIADEHTALLAVPYADRVGAGLALSSLIERAPSLLLRSRPPLPLNAQAADAGAGATAAASNTQDGLWARGWASAKQVLGALFVVRRTDTPVAPLLPPEQEALVVELLQLRLESARGALLRDQTAGFRAALGSAQTLLDEDYRKEDPAVVAARAQLESLKQLDLSPPLPDLSRSLGLLRAFLDARP